MYKLFFNQSKIFFQKLLTFEPNLSIEIPKSMIKKVFYFYYDGFRNSSLGKKLLVLIGIKLFILFFILKLFFFRDFLSSKFTTKSEKSDYVTEQLTKNK
jgi:hypothetical protein